MMLHKNRCYLILVLALISLAFLLLGLDSINRAVDPAFEDTGTYLECALFIKERGGALNFLNLVLSGEYKVAEQHPLYLVLLSPFATRELSFFPKAKLLTLVIGMIVVVSFFFITRDLFGETVTLIASVLLVFSRDFLVRSSHVAVETLLILFVLLSWYFIVKGMDNKKNWMWAGLVAGLAYMTKGTGIFLVPIFVISTLWIFKFKILRNKYYWLFFLFFGLSSSPLILRNILVYKNPLYEGINNQIYWLDSLQERNDPKYEFLVDWREHTYSARNLPTMVSYFQTHSLAEVVKRAMKGMKGEFLYFIGLFRILTDTILIRCMAFLLFLLFLIGLTFDNDRGRRTYSIVTILLFFIPLAWMFQAGSGIRFLTPLIPLVSIYTALGCIGLVNSGKMFSRVDWRRRLSPIGAYALPPFLVLFIMYVIATGKVYPVIHSVDLSDDQYAFLQWLKDNVREDDIVLLGPTSHYWGLLWHAGFRGKLVPTPENLPLSEETVSAFNHFLKKRNVSIIILHKENYQSPKILGNYFQYNERDGVVEKQPIDGWMLVHKYPPQPPTKFLIYCLSH